MNERVKRQEEARGWHRALEREDYHDDRDNQDMPRFHLSEGQRSFLNRVKAPREWEHDRRLRGQYE